MLGSLVVLSCERGISSITRTTAVSCQRDRTSAGSHRDHRDQVGQNRRTHPVDYQHDVSPLGQLAASFPIRILPSTERGRAQVAEKPAALLSEGASPARRPAPERCSRNPPQNRFGDVDGRGGDVWASLRHEFLSGPERCSKSVEVIQC